MAKRTSKPNRKQDVMRGRNLRYWLNDIPRSIDIDLQPDKFSAWLAEAQSFTYAQHELLLTVRREKRASGSFWYAYKTHQGKTYKVYIGSDDNVTPGNMKQAVQAMQDKINQDET